MVTAREACPNAMMGIHHARHAVEAEAVKLILLYPKPEIAEQETENLVVAVVEEAAIPELVASFAALVEILVV